jgi:uncharacterized membrane protein
MIKVAAALNSFAPVASHVDVPPIEEPVFIITSSQLEAILSQAIERATSPLAARLDALEERGVGCREGGEDAPDSHKGQDNLLQVVHALQAENVALKRELETFQEHVAQERAFDRQRIARLEHKEPQPLQKDRGEILRALIAANGGKMLAKDARKKMHLSKSRFSELLATMEDSIETKLFHSDKRSKVLLLK